MTMTSESGGIGAADPRPVRLRAARVFASDVLSGSSTPRLRFVVVRNGVPLSLSESSITIGSSCLEEPGVTRGVARVLLGTEEIAGVAEARALPFAREFGTAATGGGGGGGRA